MFEEKLISLAVGETLKTPDRDTYAMAVPGGWLFITSAFNTYSETPDISVTSTFVPFIRKRFFLMENDRFKELFPEGSPQRKSIEKSIMVGKVEYTPKIEKATISVEEKVLVFEAIENNGTVYLDYETFVN